MLRTPRIGRVAALLLVLAAAAPATASAGARAQVQWSSPEPSQQHAPYVNVDVIGGSGAGGQWAGPCASGCTAPSGFHWEEASHNAAGHPQTISLVDDAPQQGRSVCIVVQHPFSPSIQSGGRITGSLTLTDVDGTSRSVYFSVDKGQSAPRECSPVTAPQQQAPDQPAPPPSQTGGPFFLDPPGWWREGRAVLEARGGRCTQTRQSEPKPGGTWSFDVLECRSRIPVETAIPFGGNPNATELFEHCHGEASQGRPVTDQWFYDCEIFAVPTVGGRPNPLTWACDRDSFFSPGYGTYVDAWVSTTGRALRWPRRLQRDLDDCLAPRATFELAPRSPASAARRGLDLRGVCSRACRVRVSVLRGRRVVGRGTASRRAWRSGSVRVPLGRGARGARELRLRVDVRAGRVRGTDTVTARIAGGRWRAAEAADAAMTRR